MKWKCTTCKTVFELTSKQRFNLRHGKNVFCSRRCIHINRGHVLGGAKYKGFCKTCKKAFVSARKDKIYCDLKCYQADPGFVERLREMSPKGHAARAQKHGYMYGRTIVNCSYCDADINVTNYRARNKKRFFCNQEHYRRYLAGRFDRWIASPQSIYLPQNFDEFMTQERLPCLIENCNWEGQNLSYHVNIEHGITSDDFKMLAGFNLGTGLVCPELSEKMREKAYERGGADLYKNIGCSHNLKKPNSYRKYASEEGSEHYKKARILGEVQYADSPNKKYGKCLFCDNKFEQPYCVRKKYCSIVCRNRFYAKKAKKYLLECYLCEDSFRGDLRQWERLDGGKPVFCSLTCRNTFLGNRPKKKGSETYLNAANDAS